MTVGVVGLGGMGSRTARRLADAGNHVVVWNRTRERAQELGLDVTASPAAAARRADALVTMVASPDALREMVEGTDGIAAGADRSLTMIEMSTVGPAAIAWLRATLPTETGLLDAPVLGSITEVESASLSIFVGGPTELAGRWTPLLRALGEPIHVGPLGAGAAAKLVANTTLLGVAQLLGEAIALGDGLGLDREATWQVLSRTPLAAQAERRRGPLESGEFPERFRLALARKDADLIAAAAGDAGVAMPLSAAARYVLAAAEEAGWGDRDYSSILAWIVAANRDPSGPSL
jgi:3-hydroxyisobutyrate dehydrogenase/2-hydroxy-3-oxopropionate reductase